MYNFIYYVIYNQQLEKGKSPGFSRYNGCLIVALALIIHMMFLFAITKSIILHWFEKHFRKIETWNVPIFVITIFIIVFSYYNKEKSEKILNKFSNYLNPTRTINYMKIMLIMFIPLLIAIILSKNY